MIWIYVKDNVKVSNHLFFLNNSKVTALLMPKAASLIWRQAQSQQYLQRGSTDVYQLAVEHSVASRVEDWSPAYCGIAGDAWSDLLKDPSRLDTF